MEITAPDSQAKTSECRFLKNIVNKHHSLLWPVVTTPYLLKVRIKVGYENKGEWSTKQSPLQPGLFPICYIYHFSILQNSFLWWEKLKRLVGLNEERRVKMGFLFWQIFTLLNMWMDGCALSLNWSQSWRVLAWSLERDTAFRGQCRQTKDCHTSWKWTQRLCPDVWIISGCK